MKRPILMRSMLSLPGNDQIMNSCRLPMRRFHFSLAANGSKTWAESKPTVYGEHCQGFKVPPSCGSERITRTLLSKISLNWTSPYMTALTVLQHPECRGTTLDVLLLAKQPEMLPDISSSDGTPSKYALHFFLPSWNKNIK